MLIANKHDKYNNFLPFGHRYKWPIERWVPLAADKGQRFALADLVIAALAAEIGGLVWSLDKDFAQMEKRQSLSLGNVALVQFDTDRGKFARAIWSADDGANGMQRHSGIMGRRSFPAAVMPR